MNPRLLVLAFGVGVGYVLGTRDGRGRYNQMKAQFDRLWHNPRVAKARRDVESYAREQAPIIKERAESAAKAAPGAVADSAKDVADKVTSTARDAAGKVSDAASNVRDQAGKVASDLRERGESAVDSAVSTAGEARDRAMAGLDDYDDDDDDDDNAPHARSTGTI